MVHPIINTFMLKKCLSDASSVVPTENVGMKNNLSYEEVPVQILGRQVCKLRTKELLRLRSFGGTILLKKRLGKLRRI